MRRPRHVSRNESSEEIEDADEYGQEYLSQCTQGLENFFLAVDSGQEDEIIQSLNCLSEELTMTDEQILNTQPLDRALTLLIDCLNKENSEILLLSMTCITLILDTLPDLSGVIVECEGLNLICEKIKNLAFIELCDQGIKTLEKVSLEYPLQVLEARAIESCLTVIEFLDLESQKKILNIMCCAIKALETLEVAKFQILPLIPQILELIKNKTNINIRVEKVLEFISSFVENLLVIIPHKGNHFKEYAKAFVDFGLLNVFLELYNVQSENVLRVLCVLCERSSIIVKKFFSIGGFCVVKEGIETQSSKNLYFTGILNLLDSILPIFPANDAWNREKLNFFTKNSKYMDEISELILPRTKTIAEKFLSKEDKSIMISILEKILKFTNIERSNSLTCQSFSTFLSELMASKDLSTVRAALRISLTLYEKIPEKISGNFTREGVIARINALKDPDRLKDFKKLPVKRFGGNFDDIVFRPNESKNPYQIEAMLSKMKNKNFKPDSLDDYKKEILIYVKKILEKHKPLENKKVPRIGKDIKAISHKLASCFGESAHEILLKVTSLLKSSEKLSYYEISNSSIAESLWKWLVESNSDKLFARISEFLKIFTKDSIHHENLFMVLVKYMIGTAIFVHHFRILLHDKKVLSLRRNQKAKIILEYSGSDQYINDESFRIRHELFSAKGKFHFYSSLLLTFEKLRELLLRIVSEEDLYTLLQQKIISETTIHMFLENPYAADYQIVFLNGVKEVSRHMTVLNMSVKKSQIQLKFKIVKKPLPDLQFKYLKNQVEILEHIITESANPGIDQKHKSYSYLRLTKFLFNLNEFFPCMNYLFGIPNMQHIQIESFQCSKLSALLNRQLQDLVSTEGNIPAAWIKTLPIKSKFLFSSDARFSYFKGFGMASISQIEKKQKVRVSRNNIFNDAFNIFKDTGLHMETILDIEYEEEPGTGIGPTVEFFTLVSEKIKNLPIWRNMCEDSGLFPAPFTELQDNWEELFEFVGKFIGKAIIDKRYIDFKLCPALWKLVFNQPLCLLDLQNVDKNIGKHLVEFCLHPGDAEKTGLLFTLPGYDHIELKPGGSNVYLTKSNLEEYTYLCSTTSLNQMPQARCLRKGLDSIIPVDTLSILTISEIEDILLGENDSPWELETLMHHIIPSHGYTENSKTFQNLISVLRKFNSECKKMFLEFVTGFPRLPIGGFEKLQPKLTVVKKDVFDNPDSVLPSVMTCQNYLKIPDYSNIETLESKLLIAISEGRQAFDLS